MELFCALFRTVSAVDDDDHLRLFDFIFSVARVQARAVVQLTVLDRTTTMTTTTLVKTDTLTWWRGVRMTLVRVCGVQ